MFRTSSRHTDTSLAAAEVIWRRLPIIWSQMWRPTASGQHEMVHMLMEKPLAFYEGLYRMQMQIGSELMQLWVRPFASRSGTPATRIANAATAPARARLSANRARLRQER